MLISTKNTMKKCKVLILVSFIMILLVGCGEKEVAITDYVNVYYYGFNGKATASVDVDFSELEEVIVQENEDVSLSQLVALEKSIKCEIDKTENISNGDKINVSISWNEDLAKNCGVKFSGVEKSVEVSELEDAIELDLFKDIVIDYSGVSPGATAKVRNLSKDSYLSSVRYTIENNANIANGDEIKVVAKCDATAAEMQGYIINETEHTFIAEGIDEYITKYSEIDEVTFDKMEAHARDLVEADLADRYEYSDIMYPENIVIGMDPGEVISIELTNAYFFVLKEGMEKDYFSVGNSLFMIYTVTAKDERSPEGKTVYVPVYFKDFIMRDTGLDVVITDAYVTSNTYEVYDNLFRDIVTANKDKYTYEEVTY